MAEKLTKRLIDSLIYEDGNAKDIRWDSEMSGFGIRLYATGKKSFVLSYRINGKKTLYTIGQYGKITLEQARELARKRFGEIADNKDPLAARKATKKKHRWTVKKAAEDFIKQYAQHHTKNWKETQRIFNHDLIPVIGKKPLDEVNKDDILKILDNIVERGSRTMANRTLAHIRKFFNWCVQRNLIPFSPAYKLAPPAKNVTRSRVLHDPEIKEIWELLDNNMSNPFASLMKMLFLTAQRRSEVASMRWQDINIKEATWTIPREMNKSDRDHHVPLSPLALDIIKSMPKLGEYIFSSTGKRPFENFSREKELLDGFIKDKRKENKQLQMVAWRIHDIRRTVASGLARLKVAPHVIERLLNHSSGVISGVAAVYNRYEYFDEVAEALEKWDAHLITLTKSIPQ